MKKREPADNLQRPDRLATITTAMKTLRYMHEEKGHKLGCQCEICGPIRKAMQMTRP